MGRGRFFEIAIHDIKTAGTVTPSSKFLIDKMLEPIDFSTAKVIIELGAGDGCVTKEILRRMTPDAELYAFEMKSEFCEILSEIDDVRLHIIPDSAEEIEKYVPVEANYVISGLPMTNFSKELKLKILTAAKKKLKSNGKYIQFSYFPIAYFDYKKVFDKVDLMFTPLNLPPAFVYVCG